MSLDKQLLQDAHDAALNVVAILEKSDNRDRLTIENAQRWASLALCKLTSYSLQQRDEVKPIKSE